MTRTRESRELPQIWQQAGNKGGRSALERRSRYDWIAR
jgi:hypothetical protein